MLANGNSFCEIDLAEACRNLNWRSRSGILKKIIAHWAASQRKKPLPSKLQKLRINSNIPLITSVRSNGTLKKSAIHALWNETRFFIFNKNTPQHNGNSEKKPQPMQTAGISKFPLHWPNSKCHHWPNFLILLIVKFQSQHLHAGK